VLKKCKKKKMDKENLIIGALYTNPLKKDASPIPLYPHPLPPPKVTETLPKKGKFFKEKFPSTY